MPRLYLTPTELQQTPLGLGLSASISQLSLGVLDQLLFRASQRCDSIAEKRLQAPGNTTLSQTANAGDTSISVASTLTLDDLAEQAAIIDTGGALETVIIKPGGVQITPGAGYTYPYPGTIQLAQPLMFGHANNTPVQFAYKEVNEAIKASQSDPYSEALQSQAAQLALAHLPPMHVGLTRIAFLNNYPIQTVYTVEHAYSFDTQYNLVFDNSNPAFTGGIILEPTAGYLRFRVGTVITPEGMVRTCYTGGFNTIPDDIKLACSYLFAEQMKQMVNPYGVRNETQGKRSIGWDTSKKSTLVQEAEDILKRYKRTV